MTQLSYRFAAAVACASLAACNQVPVGQPGQGAGQDMAAQTAAPIDGAASAPSPAVPAPTASASPGPMAVECDPPKLEMAVERGEKGARNVLLSWASAVERRDFACAARLLPSPKLTAAQYARALPGTQDITVALGKGMNDGAAGSVYYNLPVTISGGPKGDIAGQMTLVRVNDVDGATQAQLHWHFFATTLDLAAPATP